MRHRAYIRKISGLERQWISLVMEIDGSHQNCRLATTDRRFDQALEHGLRYVRTFDELRGIFPDGDGEPTITRLPWHCLWCGRVRSADAPPGQLACNETHRRRNKADYLRRNYLPELCAHPKKKKFVYRGTAMHVARRVNSIEGDCYECDCGTYHLTRGDGVFAHIDQTSGVLDRSARTPF